MALQTVVSLLPHAYYLLRKFQPEVAFCQQGALRGIGLSPVFAGNVYHGVAYLRGPDALAAGEYDPFGGQADGSQVAWSQWKGKGMGAYLVEYAADELVVRHDVVHKVLCRVGELGKGLFYLYLSERCTNVPAPCRKGYQRAFSLSRSARAASIPLSAIFRLRLPFASALGHHRS